MVSCYNKYAGMEGWMSRHKPHASPVTPNLERFLVRNTWGEHSNRESQLRRSQTQNGPSRASFNYGKGSDTDSKPRAGPPGGQISTC